MEAVQVLAAFLKFSMLSLTYSEVSKAQKSQNCTLKDTQKVTKYKYLTKEIFGLTIRKFPKTENLKVKK